MDFPKHVSGTRLAWICCEQRLQHVTRVSDQVPLRRKEATPAASHSSHADPGAAWALGLCSCMLRTGKDSAWERSRQPVTFSYACPTPPHPSRSHPNSCEQEWWQVRMAKHSRRAGAPGLHQPWDFCPDPPRVTQPLHKRQLPGKSSSPHHSFAKPSRFYPLHAGQ